MLVLKILGVMFAIGFTGIVSITMAHDLIPMYKVPRWLKNTYELVWNCIGKFF